MILSGVVNRPDHIWNESWMILSDGLLHEQRLLAHNTGNTYLSDNKLYFTLKLKLLMSHLVIHQTSDWLYND